jgi:hypothetical protein
MEIDAISAIAASVSASVAALALSVAALQVHYLRKQIVVDYEWKRREKAFLYSQVYHSDVREARERIAVEFPHARVARIPLAEFAAAAKRNQNFKDDMLIILIYLENIGLAVHHNVADLTVIYDINGNEIIRFGDIFREYIEATKEGNPRMWQNIDRLIKRLSDERDTQRRMGCQP